MKLVTQLLFSDFLKQVMYGFRPTWTMIFCQRMKIMFIYFN